MSSRSNSYHWHLTFDPLVEYNRTQSVLKKQSLIVVMDGVNRGQHHQVAVNGPEFSIVDSVHIKKTVI